MTHTATDRALLLPRARPSEAGVDAAAVTAFLDALEAGGIELHSLMILRHGQVLAEGWWTPYAPDRVHLLYSLSKSFTSTAVGFCLAEGRFSLEDRIVELMPEHTPSDATDRVRALTVHHLLSMSTGHVVDTLHPALVLEPHDVIRGFLRISPEEPVGSRHVYNNATTYVLAALVEKASGERLVDYLRPRLFDKLGIDEIRWQVDEYGQALGFSGLHLQTESVAAFGQLLLQDGVWQGERILPDGWVALATRLHIENSGNGENGDKPDWQQGYGYQFWMARHGFRGDGALGQFCVVVPELDLVVATTAFAPDMQAVLDAVWAHLLPGVSADDVGAEPDQAYERQHQHQHEREHDEAEAQLAERLTRLALPVVQAGPEVVVTQAHTFEVRDADPLSPFVTGTHVTLAPDGADALISVAVGEATLTFPCGRSQWSEGSLGGTLIVCQGGWTDRETFEGELVLIETPHRIRLHAKGSQIRATWNIPPLTGSRIESQLPGAVWSTW